MAKQKHPIRDLQPTKFIPDTNLEKNNGLLPVKKQPVVPEPKGDSLLEPAHVLPEGQNPHSVPEPTHILPEKKGKKTYLARLADATG